MKENSLRERLTNTLKRFRTTFVRRRRSDPESHVPSQNMAYGSAPAPPVKARSAFQNRSQPTPAFENDKERQSLQDNPPMGRATTCPPGTIDSAAMDISEHRPKAAEGNAKRDACPICFTEMAERTVYETDCGHRFHHCCITGWLRTAPANGCPMCRTPISLRPLSEAIWRAEKYTFGTEEDVEANMPMIRRIIKEVDERNRNFCSRDVSIDRVPVPYFVTGRIRMLMQSHMSLYYIVFVWQDKVYEASVDTSKSMAYYMRLDVKLLDNIQFDIQYVDH